MRLVDFIRVLEKSNKIEKAWTRSTEVTNDIAKSSFRKQRVIEKERRESAADTDNSLKFCGKREQRKGWRIEGRGQGKAGLVGFLCEIPQHDFTLVEMI